MYDVPSSARVASESSITCSRPTRARWSFASMIASSRPRREGGLPSIGTRILRNMAASPFAAVRVGINPDLRIHSHGWINRDLHPDHQSHLERMRERFGLGI